MAVAKRTEFVVKNASWFYWKKGKIHLKQKKGGKDLGTKEIGQYAQGILLQMAHTGLKNLQKQKRFPVQMIVDVDGKHYKQIIDVNPFGRLSFRVIENSYTMIKEMKKLLILNSPVYQRNYINSHVFLWDGAGGPEVATLHPEKKAKSGELDRYLDRDLHKMKTGYPAYVVNAQPYALWLERAGYTASSKRLKRAGYAQMKGVYYKVSNRMRRQFGAQYYFKLRILNAASSQGRLNPGYLGTLIPGRKLAKSEYRKRKKAKGGVETYKLYGYPTIEYRKRKNTTLRLVDLTKQQGEKF